MITSSFSYIACLLTSVANKERLDVFVEKYAVDFDIIAIWNN